VKDLHLLAHPGVHDAAVVAMPDACLEERTCAFVIAWEDPPTAAELRRFLRVRRGTGFKIPTGPRWSIGSPTPASARLAPGHR